MNHLHTKTNSSAPCILVGASIDCLTTAVVLASLHQSVVMYTDKFEQMLARHAYEYELIALYQMYAKTGQIKLADFKDFCAEGQTNTPFFWLFVEDELFADVPIKAWLGEFNKSGHQQTPVILSGAGTVGYFADLANELKRALVYYVPFVFLADGRVFASMLNPTLWLVGEKTAGTWHKLSVLQPLSQKAEAVHISDIATAEFARASIMGMLATRVSFVNELSRLADVSGVDMSDISKIMGLDTRIGNSYLKAGAGYAGQSLPSEMAYLASSFADFGVDSTVLSAVARVNDDQKELIFRKFWQYFDGFIDGKTVVIWGGSYKDSSGRTQNSAIHPILHLLWSYNITTIVAAGTAQDELKHLYEDNALFVLTDNPYKLDTAAALFVLNRIEPIINTSTLNAHALPVFDAGNVLCAAEIEQLAHDYLGVGREYKAQMKR